MVAGADSINGMDLLRHGALPGFRGTRRTGWKAWRTGAAGNALLGH
jgi:hypothetical protein